MPFDDGLEVKTHAGHIEIRCVLRLGRDRVQSVDEDLTANGDWSAERAVHIQARAEKTVERHGFRPGNPRHRDFIELQRHFGVGYARFVFLLG